MIKHLIAGTAGFLLVLSGCSDARTGLERTSSRSLNAISEARFGGGNADFFFGLPLAMNPQPWDLNFDPGLQNLDQRPYVRVCETDGTPTMAGCVTDVTLAVTGSATGIPLVLTDDQEFYRGLVSTKLLDTQKNYRVEVWGQAISSPAERETIDARWLFGWRDITHTANQTACSGNDAYCGRTYGIAFPVQARIENFVFCPVARNCSVQFIAPGEDALFDAKLPEGSGAPNAQLFVPAQEGTGFALAFEPCTPAEDAAVSNALDIPTFGPCLRTSTTFTGQLVVPAVISLCDELDAESFGLTHAQEHQLSLHHLTNDLSVATALPEAWSCSATTASSREKGEGSLLRLASAVKNKLAGLVSVKTLHAAPIPIDRGGGGLTLALNSFFKLALPAKFEYASAGDAARRRVAGSTVTLSAKVTDLFGEPVRNARVRWSVVSAPAPGASVTGATPVLTNASGIATTTVQISTALGDNVFHASGRGIAADGATRCSAPSPDTSSCDGPRGAFDPFLPIHSPEFDAAGTELPIDIAEGTYLPFTVTGCAAGTGTATVDGTFSANEWDCARSFNFMANAGGGATPATLYVMNDGSRLYLAVRVQTDRLSKLQFNFDNDNDGASEAGDDVLSLDAITGLTDAFLTLKCSNSSQSSCWASDVSAGGTNDGTGAIGSGGGFMTYELSHPLNTADDAHDFSRSVGQTVGLFLTLQTGNGASGNTQWPGFRSYLAVTIAP
jgi:hypothetical protein